jgi:hypothetical protein
VKSGKRIALSSSFILENSESVFIDHRQLERSMYVINYQRGLIRINAALAVESEVTVSYIRMPFLLNSVYSLRDIEFGDTRERYPVRKTDAIRKPSRFNPLGNLKFGGMKSISLTSGSNKSTSLDQTLRATVEGDLTSTIRVKALLSDNNLPIQPEGNTEELEYLDKVFIEFTGPSASATLGDFAFSNDVSSYSTFRRELKGASGEATFKGTSIGLAGGSSKGVFQSVTFRGTDQLQGPYELLSQGRLLGEVIIAGTERVYMDGDLLRRGQNRDYTIDYDRGTITFTPRRAITADTEIAVDFEITQEQYDRTSVFGRVGANMSGGWTFRAMVARERDDAGRPRSLSLDEQDDEIIRNAGDNVGLAIANGADAVGVGNGDYTLISADSVLGVSAHYEFNDSTGDYVLSFVELGPGKGEYILNGITAEGKPIYLFAGTAQGNYIVGRRLPLPQSHGLFAARLSKVGGEHFDLDFEYNVSEFDRNTRSPIGDEDNTGDAGALRLRLKTIPVGLGRLDFLGSVSTIQDRFRSLDKARPWYYYRDWNLERDALVGREVLEEITSSFSRGSGLKLHYALGMIQRDNFDGIKHEGGVNLLAGSDRRFNGRVFDTVVDGEQEERTRAHGTFSLSYGFWKIKPSILYSAEEFLITSAVRADSGIAYDRVNVRIEKREAKRLSLALDLEERNTDEFADTTGWVDSRRDRTLGVLVGTRGIETIQGEAQYSHRVQDNWLLGDRRTSDLARLKGLLRLQKVGLRTNFDYEISQNQFRRQQKSVVFVGEGQGDYNALGEPVGKGRGNYTLVFLPTLETIPTHSVDFTMHMTWRPPSQGSAPSGGGPLRWLASNVSLDQTFAVKEESTFDKAYKTYLLIPSALQRDGSTIYGITSLRQDWSLLNSYPNLSLTLRYQRDDEEENRFGGVNEERFFEQQIARIDRSISRRLSANLELKRDFRRRGGKGLTMGTGSTYDVHGWAVAGGWGLRFTAGSTLDGEVEFRTRRDSESGAEERVLSLKPRFVLRVSRSLNLFGTYEVSQIWDRDGTGVKPFFFINSGNAQRWSLTPNLRLSKMISVLASYGGRSEKTFSGKRIVEHDFRLETRALF